jgi:phosphate transport system protein
MPEQAKHILSSYDAALYGSRNDILMMSSLTDRILQTAFEAFLTRNSELCDQVIAEDEEIDTLEKQVDEDGVGLLVRFHPVASDLRQVISAMKVSTNLERIGDQSVTIARRAKRLSSRPLVSEVALLEPAYRVALAIFRDSIRAFAESDCAIKRLTFGIPNSGMKSRSPNPGRGSVW